MIHTLLLSLAVLGQSAPTAHVTVKDDLVGKGPVVKDGDIVAVDYVGKLANGVQFDTSTGKPTLMFVVGAGQVIRGWDEGVQGMREGGRRELSVPPELGYGDRAVGPIPAHSSLHFTVTLVKIEPKVQITVLTKGAGSVAKVGDIAHVYFSGGLKGQPVLFDTRDKSKDPINILIGARTLPIGFVPSLAGMHEGEKRKVLMPPEVAYGSKGVPPEDQGAVKAGSIIPPNSTVEFTFELVKVERVH